MAKKEKEVAEPEGIGELPTAADLSKAFKDYYLHQADMDAARGEIGALVKNNETAKNIHRKAFKSVAALKKMDETKRSEHLRHLFHYLAVENLVPHPDLFEDSPKAKALAAKVSKDSAALDQMEAVN